MTEKSAEAPKISRRKAVKGAISLAATTALTACTPNLPPLPPEKPTPNLPLSEAEETQRKADEAFKAQKEMVLQIEKEKEALTEAIIGLTARKVEVEFVDPNNKLATREFKISHPKGVFLRNLPFTDGQKLDAFKNGEIAQGIRYFVNYLDPKSDQEYVWAVTTPTNIESYNLRELPNKEKALAVAGKKYVFFCLKEGQEVYGIPAKTK